MREAAVPRDLCGDVRGRATRQTRLAALLLGPTRNVGLRTRVSTLAATRAAVVEEQNWMLHRLEYERPYQGRRRRHGPPP